MLIQMKAWPEQPCCRGAVKVHKGREAILLKPGQQAVISNGTITKLPNADIEQAIAWKNSFFQFDGIGLPELMRRSPAGTIWK